MVQYSKGFDIMLTALYIHVPFCNSICTYCDFHKEVATLAKKKRYIMALKKELQSHRGEYDYIESIYIGGGTPSSLPNDLLIELLSEIKTLINLDHVIEYTIETNPNDITKDLTVLLKEYGINRISMGVQSFNEAHLSFMKRSHRNHHVYQAIKNIRAAGIDNVSVDMMFSLINQTMDELILDIKEVLSLDVNHISYYSLILEEKSTLYHLYNMDKISINDDDLEALMYNKVIDSLEHAGFHQYEISNFSKGDFESRHNKIYWTNLDYLGLGSGSHSLYNNERHYNVASVKNYYEAIENNLSYQTSYERNGLEEELMMGLRLLKGIDVLEVNKQYSVDIFKKYDKLHYFIGEGLLELSDGHLKFTRKGLLLGNIVFGHFLEG